MQRDLTEVLASQNKMLERSNTSVGAIPDGQVQTLFAAELNKCEKWLAEQPNFKVLHINPRIARIFSEGEGKRLTF